MMRAVRHGWVGVFLAVGVMAGVLWAVVQTPESLAVDGAGTPAAPVPESSPAAEEQPPAPEATPAPPAQPAEAPVADAPDGDAPDGDAPDGDAPDVDAAAYDPLFTAQALNMATVSVCTIVDTKDRRVLDAEYWWILNNLKMGNIEDDDEIKDAYRDVMDFITDKKLREEEASRQKAKMEKAQSRSFLRSAAGIRAYGADPLSFALSLATSVAGAAMNYYEEKESFQEAHDDAQWELIKEETQELNALNKTFMDSAWTLLRKYGLADELCLREADVRDYLNVMKEADDEKALRMFENLEGRFQAYPPFFFHYGLRAEKAGQRDLATQCYAEYERLWRDVLRRDPHMAAVAVAMLSRTDPKKDPEKFQHYMVLAKGHLRDNGDGLLRFGIAAALNAAGDKEQAMRLLQHNVDWGTAARESALALDNLRQGDDFLDGIEDERFMAYDFDEISSEADQKEAFLAYQRQAAQGNADVQLRLGLCYRDGTGVEADPKTAVEWFRKAAEQGNADAQYCLGDCYLDGTGVEADPKTAVEWYRKAAEQGNAMGQCALGTCYRDGIGVEADPKAAVEWFRKAAAQGNADAQYCLGDCYLDGTGGEADPKTAVEWYRKAAAQGNATAQFRLGRCYRDGTGVEADLKAAVEWYRKAAAQGNADAQRHLGHFYRDGTGVEADPKAAVEWYRKAAEQGNADAQYFLGNCYLDGTGVEADPKTAVEWYRKAAEQEDPQAEGMLGHCYITGKGVEADPEAAVRWFRKAAHQGDVLAQWSFGRCYEKGVGMEADPEAAVWWFRKAAHQGSALAQWSLGRCYEDGVGVEADPKAAVEWYRKAAEQGDAEAQFQLGLCYEEGKGVEKDAGKAKEWLDKAAAQGVHKKKWYWPF